MTDGRAHCLHNLLSHVLRVNTMYPRLYQAYTTRSVKPFRTTSLIINRLEPFEALNLFFQTVGRKVALLREKDQFTLSSFRETHFPENCPHIRIPRDSSFMLACICIRALTAINDNTSSQATRELVFRRQLLPRGTL